MAEPRKRPRGDRKADHLVKLAEDEVEVMMLGGNKLAEIVAICGTKHKLSKASIVRTMNRVRDKWNAEAAQSRPEWHAQLRARWEALSRECQDKGQIGRAADYEKLLAQLAGVGSESTLRVVPDGQLVVEVNLVEKKP